MTELSLTKLKKLQDKIKRNKNKGLKGFIFYNPSTCSFWFIEDDISEAIKQVAINDPERYLELLFDNSCKIIDEYGDEQ